MLLGAVIIPFPTAVLAGAFADGADSDKRVAVVLYALAAAFMSVTWLAAFSYLSRHPELLQSDTPPRYARQQLRRPIRLVLARRPVLSRPMATKSPFRLTTWPRLR